MRIIFYVSKFVEITKNDNVINNVNQKTVLEIDFQQRVWHDNNTCCCIRVHQHKIKLSQLVKGGMMNLAYIIIRYSW